MENNDFDFDRIAVKGGKFLAVHENAAISRKEDNLAFGQPTLAPRAAGRPIPHGSQTAGSNEAAGGCKRKELGGPHLVLPHIGYDDCILIGIGFGSVKECFWCNDAFFGALRQRDAVFCLRSTFSRQDPYWAWRDFSSRAFIFLIKRGRDQRKSPLTLISAWTILLISTLSISK